MLSTRPKIVAIIPARLHSEEVHAKVLVDLAGKPVIQHVHESVANANVFDEVLIAADDNRILDVARDFGAHVYLTQEDHICGTDRCAEAARQVFPQAEIVVNIQADEPFLNPKMIPLVIDPLVAEENWDMTTLCCASVSAAERASPFAVKVARSTTTGRALYFSRAVIPYPRYADKTKYFQHIGIYGYRMSGLQRFAAAGPSPLELAEGLEQLRALEAEMRIKVISTDLPYPRVAIDTQEDIDRARQCLTRLHGNRSGQRSGQGGES